MRQIEVSPERKRFVKKMYPRVALALQTNLFLKLFLRRPVSSTRSAVCPFLGGLVGDIQRQTADVKDQTAHIFLSGKGIDGLGKFLPDLGQLRTITQNIFSFLSLVWIRIQIWT
jgi:hypothetical protein